MGRKKNENSIRGISERLTRELGVEVSLKSVRVWQARGYPVDDAVALRALLLNQERSPIKPRTIHADVAPAPQQLPKQHPPVPPEQAAYQPPSHPARPAATTHIDVEHELKQLQRKLLEADDYATARTIRMQIAGVRDVLKSLREQGHYVTKESQIRDGMAAGEAIKALVLKIPSDLPQMIIGLDYPDAVARCEDYAYQILTGLSEAKEGVLP